MRPETSDHDPESRRAPPFAMKTAAGAGCAVTSSSQPGGSSLRGAKAGQRRTERPT
ncbi:hypothetical protein [Pseudogemmobacter sp. W21_MBD1_M6]|uniref:hypothetical protein n=1 Tax=Pseudogemmobacter sp. W21_MBD1_M6 TaxID=3240271 RepID=UPI003F9719FE